MTTESKKAYYRAAAALDAAVRKANAAHAAAVQRCKVASDTMATFRNVSKYDHAALIRQEAAKAEYFAANDSLLPDANRAWHEFSSTARAIRAQLVDDLDMSDVYTAAGLDGAALKLLESGIMRAKDYQRMADDFRENPAMLALLRQKAEERCKALTGPKDYDERVAMQDVISSARTDGEKLLKGFDDLCGVAKTFSRYDDGNGGFPARSDVRYVFPIEAWEQCAGPYIHEPEEGEE